MKQSIFEVKVESFEDLTFNEQKNVSNNGCGREFASYIRVTHKGKTILLESDAMESEDATFTRDLSWIPKIINEVYKLGRGAIEEYLK